MVHKKEVPPDHKCTKGSITWASKPDVGIGDDGQLGWPGKCSICGRKVYEIYSQIEGLWDRKTNELISTF